ncbi:hypothetical protein SY2F82_21000 [Streptomyces sp. Y2F8-2]|nr:hypothetical protein SY2F82_21000 [Streptomyces sp. Y2F8-2]
MSRPLTIGEVRRVAVVGGSRIPFARSGGPYATACNRQMPTAAVDGLERGRVLPGHRPPLRRHGHPDRGDARGAPGRAAQPPSRGLISICAAGGQGVTAIPERP